MNLKVGKIDVQQPLSTAFLSLSQSSVCMGESTSLVVNLTGTAPWSITYRITSPDGTKKDITVTNISASPSLIPFTPASAGTYSFEIISVTDANNTNNTKSNIVSLTVNAKPGSSRIYQYEPVTKKKK